MIYAWTDGGSIIGAARCSQREMVAVSWGGGAVGLAGLRLVEAHTVR